MAYEFKKLSDVAVVDTPADTANVLIEEDGVIKKVAKDAVVPSNVALKSDIPDAIVNPTVAEVGQTIIVKAVDENGKPTEWECSDIVASWDDLEDKPFSVEVNEIFSAKTTPPGTVVNGLDPIDIIYDKTYKVFIDDVEYIGRGYYDDTDGPSISFYDDLDNYVGYVYYSGRSLYLSEDKFDSLVEHTVRIQVVDSHTLDPIYLPAYVPGKLLDKLCKGQVLEVEQVDEKGKPLSWSSRTLSGSIGSITSTGNDAVLILDQLSDGSPITSLGVSEVSIELILPYHASDPRIPKITINNSNRLTFTIPKLIYPGSYQNHFCINIKSHPNRILEVTTCLYATDTRVGIIDGEDTSPISETFIIPCSYNFYLNSIELAVVAGNTIVKDVKLIVNAG